MKLLAAIVLSIFAAAIKGAPTEEEIKGFQTVAIACMAETGANEEDLQILVNHKPFFRMETKCLLACIATHFGMMTTDGKMDLKSAIKVGLIHARGGPNEPTTSQIEHVFGACEKMSVPDNRCESANQFAICLKNVATEIGISKYDF